MCADAADGSAAVEIARRFRPEVMLLDLSVPGMGGREALPLIRAESAATAVVVLSGSGRRSYAGSACALVARRVPGGEPAGGVVPTGCSTCWGRDGGGAAFGPW